MIPKTGMTLDMYRRQAGLKTHSAASARGFSPIGPKADARFGEALDKATTVQPPASTTTAHGATLADYQRRRPTDAASTLFGNSTLFSGRLDRLTRRPFDNGPFTANPKSAATAKPSESETTSSAEPTAHPVEARASIQNSIQAAARKHNLPPKLIRSVIHAESNFRADAVSPAGAQGLMQLMPATARELGVTDPFDVAQNIDGGARYLRQMLDRFDGDLKLALAAYNAGPGTVQRYNGDVPYRETRDYVRRVLVGMGATEPSSA
jgi:soluble lytic murein transglycosylase-like protein